MTTRTPKPGYREHDKVSDWQECDTCALRIGAGMTTEWDNAYYAGDSSVCPRCASAGREGLMCLPAKDQAAASLGRRGRAVNSKAQQAAARANGSRGGRPRVTHYACSECSNAIERGEPGWENWTCPEHPNAMVDSVAT